MCLHDQYYKDEQWMPVKLLMLLFNLSSLLPHTNYHLFNVSCCQSTWPYKPPFVQYLKVVSLASYRPPFVQYLMLSISLAFYRQFIKYLMSLSLASYRHPIYTKSDFDLPGPIYWSPFVQYLMLSVFLASFNFPFVQYMMLSIHPAIHTNFSPLEGGTKCQQ